MKKLAFIICLSLVMSSITAQTDWGKVDFSKEYKAKFKIPGASAKSLKGNKTFVSSYIISQAVTMKGSESSSTKSVFSEVSFAGVNKEAYQQFVDEMYAELVDELSESGLMVTDGEDVMASAFVQDKIKGNRDDEFIGSTGDNPTYEGKKKLSEGSMPGYGAWAVLEDVSFQPRNKNIYVSTNLIRSGNFYLKMSAKENFNLLSLHYYITFASFEGGRGYKDISLQTNPVISVSCSVSLITPNGAFNQVYYEKLPVWGSGDWSEGVFETKDNKSASDFLGLARSAEYELKANQEKYMSEIGSIIQHLQKDIVEGIREEIE